MTASLPQFIALSDQLVALVKAGVPVHLGLPSRPAAAAVACERIGAVMARRIGERDSIAEALEDQAVPAAYRSVVQLALASGDLRAALNGASRMAEAQDETWHAVRVSLRYPLAICALAYVGIVLFCLFLVPLLESTYQNLDVPTGWGLRVATLLRDSLPSWVAIPPLVLLVLVAGLSWSAARARATGGTARILTWLPGVARITAEQRLARFAETLAGHLEAGSPLPDALQAASATWENNTLKQETLGLAALLKRGHALRDDDALAARLPPLMRWSISAADGTLDRPRALRMAARLYRQVAQRRLQRLRVVAPMVTCLVIGGGVTLFYGLALFVPLAQMIQGLAG